VKHVTHARQQRTEIECAKFTFDKHKPIALPEGGHVPLFDLARIVLYERVHPDNTIAVVQQAFAQV